MLYTHIAQWCFTSFLAPKLCIWNWSQEQGKLHFPLMLLFSKFYGALVYSLHIFSSHVTSFFTLLSSRFPSFLFGIFIFLSKNSTLISRENCRFFGWWKTRENVVVLDFLAVDNFDFTRKIVKKNLGEKVVKMVGFWSKLNFWTKIWLFEWCALMTTVCSW